MLVRCSQEKTKNVVFFSYFFMKMQNKQKVHHFIYLKDEFHKYSTLDYPANYIFKNDENYLPYRSLNPADAVDEDDNVDIFDYVYDAGCILALLHCSGYIESPFPIPKPNSRFHAQAISCVQAQQFLFPNPQ